MRLLLAAGADATAEGHDGRTALHQAALDGPDDPSLAGVLMGAGCDPAAKSSSGYTALDIAKAQNKPRMAALLEAAAADPEATLAPFRDEVAALRRMVADWGLAAALECAPLLAVDRLGRADKSLPIAWPQRSQCTRICVAGRGRGYYVAFERRRIGANR